MWWKFEFSFAKDLILPFIQRLPLYFWFKLFSMSTVFASTCAVIPTFPNCHPHYTFSRTSVMLICLSTFATNWHKSRNHRTKVFEYTTHCRAVQLGAVPVDRRIHNVRLFHIVFSSGRAFLGFGPLSFPVSHVVV